MQCKVDDIPQICRLLVVTYALYQVVESYGGISFKPSETVDGPLLFVTAQHRYLSIKVKGQPNHNLNRFLYFVDCESWRDPCK